MKTPADLIDVYEVRAILGLSHVAQIATLRRQGKLIPAEQISRRGGVTFLFRRSYIEGLKGSFKPRGAVVKAQEKPASKKTQICRVEPKDYGNKIDRALDSAAMLFFLTGRTTIPGREHSPTAVRCGESWAND